MNLELREQLERARKAADLQTSINAIGFVGNLGSAINNIAEDPSPPGGGTMTKDEALTRLGEIQKKADTRANTLQKQLNSANQKIQTLDKRVEELLRENQVPVENLPH